MPAYHLAKFQTPRHGCQVLLQRVDKRSAFTFAATPATFPNLFSCGRLSRLERDTSILKPAEPPGNRLHLVRRLPIDDCVHSFQRNLAAIWEILTALKFVDPFRPVGKPLGRVRDEARIISEQSFELRKPPSEIGH